MCDGDRGSLLTTSAVGTTPPRGGGVGQGRSDADTDAVADADVDDEGEAKEGGDVGEDEELIGMGEDDTLDAVGGICGEGDEGRGGGLDIERPPRRPFTQPSLISH